MWRVVGDSEMFWTEVEKIGNGGIHIHRRERSRFTFKKLFDMIKLTFVNMCVRNRIDEFFWRVTCCLSNHHGKRSILNDIEHDANGNITTALEMMNGKLFCFWKDENVEIAMARRNDNLPRRNS